MHISYCDIPFIYLHVTHTHAPFAPPIVSHLKGRLIVIGAMSGYMDGSAWGGSKGGKASRPGTIQTSWKVRLLLP